MSHGIVGLLPDHIVVRNLLWALCNLSGIPHNPAIRSRLLPGSGHQKSLSCFSDIDVSTVVAAVRSERIHRAVAVEAAWLTENGGEFLESLYRSDFLIHGQRT
jgi:hypothetical protein